MSKTEKQIGKYIFALLKVLREDRRKNPTFQTATDPTVLFKAASDRIRGGVSPEVHRAALDELFRRHCLGQLDHQDRSYHLQISDTGLRVLVDLEEKAREAQSRRVKQAVVFGTFAVTALGVYATFLQLQK